MVVVKVWPKEMEGKWCKKANQDHPTLVNPNQATSSPTSLPLHCTCTSPYLPMERFALCQLEWCVEQSTGWRFCGCQGCAWKVLVPSHAYKCGDLSSFIPVSSWWLALLPRLQDGWLCFNWLFWLLPAPCTHTLIEIMFWSYSKASLVDYKLSYI